MSGPPEVRCPGCGGTVGLEHEVHTTLSGERVARIVRTRDIIGPPLCSEGCMAEEDCADALGGECPMPLDKDAPLSGCGPEHVENVVRLVLEWQRRWGR